MRGEETYYTVPVPSSAGVDLQCETSVLVHGERADLLRAIAYLIGRLGGRVEVPDLMLREIPGKVVIEARYDIAQHAEVWRIASRDNRA